MRPFVSSLVVLSLGLLAGTADAAPPRCSLAGTPPWRELRSPHFVLSTDLPEDDGEELSEQLEVLRGAVLAMLELPDAIPGSLPVVAFARAADWRAFAPDGLDGYFVSSDQGDAGIAMCADGSRVRAAAVVAHELTHHVLAHAFPRQPRWFSEGLAAYMEAVGEGRVGETLRIGEPPLHRLQEARGDPVPVAELLAATGRLSSRQYAASWLLVHYLFAQHPARFAAFRGRLARAQDPAAAWREEFPEWDPARSGATARLDRALARYADGGEYVQTRIVARGDGAYRFTLLRPGEVHALRLLVRSGNDGPYRDAVRAEADEALAEEPTHVGALWARASLGERALRDLAAARAAAAAHPGAARAWVLVATLTRGDEQLAALRKGVAVAGDDAGALGWFAEGLRVAGRPAEAWPLATRAARLAPWSSRVLGTCADLALALDRCGEAVSFAVRALEVLPDSVGEGSPARARAEERARGVRARCDGEVRVPSAR